MVDDLLDKIEAGALAIEAKTWLELGHDLRFLVDKVETFSRALGIAPPPAAARALSNFTILHTRGQAFRESVREMIVAATRPAPAPPPWYRRLYRWLWRK